MFFLTMCSASYLQKATLRMPLVQSINGTWWWREYSMFLLFFSVVYMNFFLLCVFVYGYYAVYFTFTYDLYYLFLQRVVVKNFKGIQSVICTKRVNLSISNTSHWNLVCNGYFYMNITCKVSIKNIKLWIMHSVRFSGRITPRDVMYKK